MARNIKTAKDIVNSPAEFVDLRNINEDLANMFFKILTTTAVPWFVCSANNQISSQATKFLNPVLRCMYYAEHTLSKYKEIHDVWKAHEDVEELMLKYAGGDSNIRKWPGFWHGMDVQPEATSEPLDMNGLTTAVYNIAQRETRSMLADSQKLCAGLVKIVSAPNGGTIINKDGECVLAPKVATAFKCLVEVGTLKY
jgi:hypothetical protein